MATCDVCGTHVDMPYNCRRCGGVYCGEHRLPENHNCVGLDQWNDPSKVFDSGFDDSVQDEGRVSGLLDAGAGGPLGYVRGNVAYTFLALMWVTFLFQFLLLPLVGVNVGATLWYDLFTLQPGHLGYVWAYVTSVFSHGGPGHILFNSIALFFFGPIVERQIGSKRFAALFLVSGVVAGLAQVLIGLFVFGSAVPVLGASGAIAAVLGILTILNPNLTVYIYFVLPAPLWLLTIGFVVINLAAGFGSFGAGTANWAHLAGLFIGLAYGKRVEDEVRPPGQVRLGGRGGGGMGGGRRRF